MKPVKKIPVLLIVSVVLCALGYVLRPLTPGLADMFRHLGFIWIGYGVFALLLQLPTETRARTVCSLTRSILSYTAVLLSVFFGLRALGVDVTASRASVGVVTRIIGFGAQSLIEDVLTGIFLIAEGRYNVGDILVLDDFRGKVVDISVRTTTLEDSGGNHKIINNSEIRNFQNRSQETSVAVSTISIGYDADLRAVEAVIADALPAMYEENRGVFLDVPQYLGVEELAGSGVVLKFIVSATEENIFAARRALITDRALEPRAGDPHCGGTIYLCTADREGNMVSFIQSNYTTFGAGVAVPGTGISLQNRGANFSLDPASDNCLAGGKRSYHTIIPGFLLKDGAAGGPFGVMGAFMQPQGQTEVLVNTLDYHMNPQEALDAPRIQWIGGRRLELEREAGEAIADELRAMGHEVTVVDDRISMGRGQIIWRGEDGVYTAGTEPRCDGAVAAW